jgi:predicted DNA-binding transcriptional regulator AlpA
MTKHEAARRDDHRRASLAANPAKPERGWVARKQPPRTPSARDSAPPPAAPERPLPERARPPPQATDKLLLGYADLQACGISYSKQHLYRKMADGTFPKPVALGAEQYSRKAWRRADILAWIAALS